MTEKIKIEIDDPNDECVISHKNYHKLCIDISNIIDVVENMEEDCEEFDLKDQSFLDYLRGMRLAFYSIRDNISIGHQIKIGRRNKL